MLRFHRVAIALATTLIGCTFAGIADYDTPSCDPTRSLEDDFCNQLNTGNTSCQRYQCDATTRRCVLGTVDIDRDGDPSPACGGTDCDDHDPLRSGKAKEVCDGIDNNCNGLTDDGVALHSVVPAIASVSLHGNELNGSDLHVGSSSSNGETYATYLGAGCVHGFSLDDPNQSDAGGGCVFTGLDTADAGVGIIPTDPDAGTTPPHATPPAIRQPELGTVGVQSQSTLGVAFIETNPSSSCDKEQLAFWSKTLGKTVLADCGASLPSLSSFPLQSTSLIAFYDARVADRADPINGCATAKAAPLKLRWVNGPSSLTPDVVTSAASNLGDAIATRPPALLALNGGVSILLGSPLGDSAGLFILSGEGRIVPLATSIPELANARSMAMAVGVEDNLTTRLAVVAERGCKPTQSLTMILASFDLIAGAIVKTQAAAGLPDGAVGTDFRTIDIVPPGTTGIVTTAPEVLWVPTVKEWWVTWIDERGKAMLRRVSKDGATLDAPIEVGAALFASMHLASTSGGAAATGDARLPTARLVRPDGSAIDEVRLTCSP